MQARGELYRVSLYRGLCRTSNSKNASTSIGSSSWNLSWECLHDQSMAECSFGLEIRNPTDQVILTPSTSSSGYKSSPSSASFPKSSWTRIANGSVTLDRQSSKVLHTGLDWLKKMQIVAVRGVAHSGMPPASPKALSANIVLGTLVIVFVLGLVKLKESVSRRKSQGEGVKTRILRSQWFKDSRSDNGKRKLDEASVALQASKSSKTDSDEFKVLDRLVIHDGEVVTNAEPRKASAGSVSTQGGVRRIRNDVGENSSGNISKIRSFLTRKERKPGQELFRRLAKPATNEETGDKGARSARNWNDKDELDLRKRVDDLRQTVQTAESNRKAAILALAEERKRSLELEVKIRRQKEAASALEEEVRVLKESHEALLNSLRKKYSSSASARAAAALLYQKWDEAGLNSDP